jgi:hypothetical protein
VNKAVQAGIRWRANESLLRSRAFETNGNAAKIAALKKLAQEAPRALAHPKTKTLRSHV